MTARRTIILPMGHATMVTLQILTLYLCMVGAIFTYFLDDR